MSLAKIIGAIITIPTIVIIIINWWIEGEIVSAILDAFSVHPFIITLLSIVGLIILIKIILDIIN